MLLIRDVTALHERNFEEGPPLQCLGEHIERRSMKRVNERGVELVDGKKNVFLFPNKEKLESRRERTQ